MAKQRDPSLAALGQDDMEGAGRSVRMTEGSGALALWPPFEPVVQSALKGLGGQGVTLIIYRLLLRHGQNVLVVNTAFRCRSIPLAWMVLFHTGSSGLADQQQVLTTALALLPERVQIIVHGDSAFRNQRSIQWLREHACDVKPGIQGSTLVAHMPTATAAHAPASPSPLPCARQLRRRPAARSAQPL